MPSSRAVFDLNNRKSVVNRHLRLCKFPKNSEVCRVGRVLFIKPWHHTLYISELKYAPTHGTFPSFLEIDKTAGARCLRESYRGFRVTVLLMFVFCLFSRKSIGCYSAWLVLCRRNPVQLVIRKLVHFALSCHIDRI